MQQSNYYAFIALELARERTAEASAQRLANLAHPGEPRTAGIRRAIARVALAIARAADDEDAGGRVPLTSH
ncbi:MAG: hypothetical protein ABIQ76_11975 [Candidatus Limnocylindrales bacterium]